MLHASLTFRIFPPIWVLLKYIIALSAPDSISTYAEPPLLLINLSVINLTDITFPYLEHKDLISDEETVDGKFVI